MIEVERPAEIAPLLAARPRGAPPLAPRGLGTRSAAPPPGTEVLSLARLRGIEDLDLEEMVLTALAGTPVDEVATLASAAGLVLCPLLPPGTRGTLGGLHASGDESPLAPAEGRVRDAVLGLEAVVGSGDALRGGGRVVKNVTGYDLTRFLSGSRGSLAVIARLHWRLRRRPERFLEVALVAPAAGLERVLRALRRAAEPTAVRVELAEGTVEVRILVEGSAAVAAERTDRISREVAREVAAPRPPAEVPLGSLAAWLDPGAGELIRGGTREIAGALHRLAADRGSRAIAFPFAGFARVRAAGDAAPGANGAPADPFAAAARAAWDPAGRLWDATVSAGDAATGARR